MAHGIKLTKSEVLHVNHHHLGAFRMRVDASEPVDMDDAGVFLYLRNPPDPRTSVETDYYQGVCSPVDMAQFPYGEPLEGASPRFFRLSYFELDFRSIGIESDPPAKISALQCWTDTQANVCVLMTALDVLEDLTPTATHVCGAAATSSESTSDSASDSASDSTSDSSSESA